MIVSRVKIKHKTSEYVLLGIIGINILVNLKNDNALIICNKKNIINDYFSYGRNWYI